MCSLGLAPIPRPAGSRLGLQQSLADPARMSNLSRGPGIPLAQCPISHLLDRRQQPSTDGTQKLLLTWEDGSNAETVMIPDGARRTACVSSQVGCPVGCKFCASGINGVKGTSAGQIVEQIFRLNELLRRAQENGSITSSSWAWASRWQITPTSCRPSASCTTQGFNIGAGKITISTVGVPPKMRAAGRRGVADQPGDFAARPQRAAAQATDPLGRAFRAGRHPGRRPVLFEQTGREITLEYILLRGVNDQPEHARQLAKLCKTLRANVNLIRYNEVRGLPFGRPESR